MNAVNMLDRYSPREDSVVDNFGIPGLLTLAGTPDPNWTVNPTSYRRVKPGPPPTWAIRSWSMASPT